MSNSQPLMALGQFVFALNTAPYQQLQHELKWRHPATARVGSSPARQFLGPDEESLTLSGVLIPELTGGMKALQRLREIADRGLAEPLVDGATGDLVGQFVIDGLSQTRSLFLPSGEARRIEFSLTLKRADDSSALGGRR